MKVVFICSTSASVIKKCFSSGFFNKYDVEFVSDRECGALEFAKENGFPYLLLESKTGKEFSDLLNSHYAYLSDVLFVSFYTKLLTVPFVDNFRGKVINFHPSILPACPGMHGFEDTISSGARFIGSTVHFVDNGIDTGKPIIQAAYPRDPQQDIKQLRHRVFLQQAISLIQVIKWFECSKIDFNSNAGFVLVASAFEVGEFSPNLEPELLSLYKSWVEQGFAV